MPTNNRGKEAALHWSDISCSHWAKAALHWADFTTIARLLKLLSSWPHLQVGRYWLTLNLKFTLLCGNTLPELCNYELDPMDWELTMWDLIY